MLGFHVKISLLGLALAAAGACVAFPGSAAATPTDPLSVASNWTTAPAGGSSMAAVLTGGSALGFVESPLQPVVNAVETLAEVIPAPSLSPIADGPIVAVVGAFAVGYLIGNAIDRKFFHMSAPGLGWLDPVSNPSAPGGTYTPSWEWLPCLGTQGMQGCYGYAGMPTTKGFLLKFLDTADQVLYSDCGRSGLGSCSTPPAAYIYQAEYDFARSMSAGQEICVSSCTSSTPHYARYLTMAQFDATFGIDQALQAYTNQPYGVSSGWANPATGAGITTPAPPYGSGPGDPAPCYMYGSTLTCTGPPTVNNPQGTPFIPGLPVDPNYTDPNVNRYRCLVDPLHFSCPTTSPLDPSTWSTTGGGSDGAGGGPVGPMPDCYGLSQSECDAGIRLARPDVTIVHTVASTPDAQVADGRVVATTPGAATDPTPSSVGVEINPSNSNPDKCVWTVENPHLSTLPGAVDVKGRANCNYQTTIVGHLTMWKCDQEPSKDLAALAAGTWGCSIPAGGETTETRLAMPGVQDTFQAPVPGGPVIAPDGKWFVAYGTLDKGTPAAVFSNVTQP